MAAHTSSKINNNTEKKSSGYVWPYWYSELTKFRSANALKATWQFINTFVPYCFLWYLMIQSVQRGYSYLWTLLLALPTAAFMLRMFILFHDCVHNSFFRLHGLNTFFGYLFGVLTFTSFEDWRFSHLRHHVTYANLDARGFGDIWTMTLSEYERASKKKRLQYRMYRNPVVLLGLGALFLFLLSNRLPTRKTGRKERMSIIFTNLLIITIILVANKFIGWWTYFLIQLPVLWFAGAAGIWLFYVQHQFAGGYWARKGEWESLRAAMEGSSFYKLPLILRWFSSNIGYHHVHHLGPRIPNYYLKKCYDSVPALQNKVPLTIRKSFYSIQLKLWDEKQQKMIAFPSKT